MSIVCFFGNDPSAGSPTERIFQPELSYSLYCSPPKGHFLPGFLSKAPLSGWTDWILSNEAAFFLQSYGTHHPLPYSLCASCQRGQFGSGLPIPAGLVAESHRLLPSNGALPRLLHWLLLSISAAVLWALGLPRTLRELGLASLSYKTRRRNYVDTASCEKSCARPLQLRMIFSL